MRSYFYPWANFAKATEGGASSQKEVKRFAKEEGIEVRVGPGAYVGQFLVSAKCEDQRKLNKLARRINRGY